METSTGSTQLKEGYVKGEKKTEQGDDDEDRFNLTLGNQLHTEAAPAPTYARPDRSAVASGQPDRRDTQERTGKRHRVNTSKEKRKGRPNGTTLNKKKLINIRPCKRLEKETRRQGQQRRRGKTKRKCV